MFNWPSFCFAIPISAALIPCLSIIYMSFNLPNGSDSAADRATIRCGKVSGTSPLKCFERLSIYARSAQSFNDVYTSTDTWFI